MVEKQIIIADSQQQLNELAADHFRNSILQAVEKHGQALVALSGGNTPAGLFSTLIQASIREQIPWNAVHFFWADERWVPYDDPESNFGQAKRLLFDHVPVSFDHIHAVNVTLPLAESVEQYRQEILKFTTPGHTAPRFDWILLGMGSDGHTASLFPGSPLAINKQDLIRSVQAQYENRPALRITMTENLLNQAREVLFLIKGKSKATMIKQVMEGPYLPLDFPSLRIRPNNGHLTWLIDRDAAESLSD